jgi:hypothetical protein
VIGWWGCAAMSRDAISGRSEARAGRREILDLGVVMMRDEYRWSEIGYGMEKVYGRRLPRIIYVLTTSRIGLVREVRTCAAAGPRRELLGQSETPAIQAPIFFTQRHV